MARTRHPHSLFRLLLVLALAAAVAWSCAPKKPAEPEAPEPGAPGEGYFRLPAAKAREFAAALTPADQGLDSWTELRGPLARSIDYLRARPAHEPALDRKYTTITWGQLRQTARDLMLVLDRLDENPEILAEQFVWFELRPKPLMTGYYAPEIAASLEPDPDYPYPLYGLPEDLRRLDLGEFHPRWEGQKLLYRVENATALPYFDRKAIDLQGALAGRGLEIAWARHPWDIYHLQVQGSGYLRLPDGSTRFILYAGKNGRVFRSAERYLLQQDLIEPGQMHRDGIRAAIDAAVDDPRELLAVNPSYVFFRLADSPPVGSMGEPLTGMVSLATDPDYLPLGSVVPVSAELRLGRHEQPRELTALGLAQDTGGVITGCRIDYYMGQGHLAGYRAFNIKNRVRAWLLVSRRALGNR